MVRPTARGSRKLQCAFSRPRRAGRTRCQATATYRAGIALKSSKYDGDKYFFFDSERLVCSACSGALVVEDLVTDRNWSKIVAEFARHGHKKPARKLVRLIFEVVRR